MAGRRACQVARTVCVLLLIHQSVLASASKRKAPELETRDKCVEPSELELIKEGMMFVYNNEDKKASEWFHGKCPNATEGELNLMCTCFYWAFRAHTAVNESKWAHAALDGALGLAGHDAQLLSLKGEQLTRDEKFVEAADYFQQAAKWYAADGESESGKETEEKLTKLYYNAATAYVQVGKGEEALAMYAKVLETENGASKWAIHNSMGLLYYDLEQDEKAIASYETALELESDHPAVLRNLAGVYLRTGNATAAMPLLRISAVREPSSFEAWYYLGAAYSQLARHKDAAYAFGNASALNPNHTDARRYLGEECAQAEDFVCAVRELSEAARQLSLRAFYGGCAIYTSLGGVYMELGMFKEAKNTFEAVLVRCDCAHHPTRDTQPEQCVRDPQLLVDLALAELSLGDAAGANASLSAALEQSLLDSSSGDPSLAAADSGVMPDLLLARAMLGDLTAPAQALELYSRGEFVGGTPVHFIALGFPAPVILELTSQIAASRREFTQEAAGGGGGGGVRPLALPPSHPRQSWLRMLNTVNINSQTSDSSVLRVGFLVCSTALRGADMETLKHLLLSSAAVSRSRDMSVPAAAPTHSAAPPWLPVLYDWCVHSALTGLAAPFDGVNNRQREEEDEAEDSVMSVMEELASENADVSRIRVGQVGIRDSASAARVINGDGVHVLVSLDGWNLKNRNNILFHRPCAIQVSALGHRGSMGDSAAHTHARTHTHTHTHTPPLVDAVIGGRVSTPPEYAAHFAEALMLLPLGYMPPCPCSRVPASEARGGGGLSPEQRDAVKYTSVSDMDRGDRAAQLRQAARMAWRVYTWDVVLAVFGPPEALSPQSLAAWGAPLLPAAARAQASGAAGGGGGGGSGRAAVKVSIGMLASGEAGAKLLAQAAAASTKVHILTQKLRIATAVDAQEERQSGRGGGQTVAEERDFMFSSAGAEVGNGTGGWIFDAPGDGAGMNASVRLHGSDLVLDTWRVSAGALIGKALALNRPILTFPQDTMASRTGAEHAVSLNCSHCALARTAEDAASFARALARRAIASKARTSGADSSSEEGAREFGHLTPLWCSQFIRGLSRLLEAHMSAEAVGEEEGAWLKFHVALAY